MKIDTDDFNLNATIESGQIFGFSKLKNNVYEIQLNKIHLKIRQSKNTLFIDQKYTEELFSELENYFDLKRDLTGLYDLFYKNRKLQPLLKLKGLRIMRQDKWEATGSFIISSNNNIKRIQKIWFSLAQNLGENNCFPSPEKLSEAGIRFLKNMGLGYRAEYLKDSARIISEDPLFFKRVQEEKDEEAARELLKKLPGVGNKVADCILLFGFQKMTSFPVDVWIEKIMSYVFF